MLRATLLAYAPCEASVRRLVFAITFFRNTVDRKLRLKSALPSKCRPRANLPKDYTISENAAIYRMAYGKLTCRLPVAQATLSWPLENLNT